MDLMDWLVRTVGIGEQERIRRRLYAKLVRLVERHGDEVKRIILRAWAYAKAEHTDPTPDHLFCRAVRRKLIDAKLYHEPQPYDQLSGADLDRQFLDEGPLPLFDGAERQAKGKRTEPTEMTREEMRAIIEQRMRQERQTD